MNTYIIYCNREETKVYKYNFNNISSGDFLKQLAEQHGDDLDYDVIAIKLIQTEDELIATRMFLFDDEKEKVYF